MRTNAWACHPRSIPQVDRAGQATSTEVARDVDALSVDAATMLNSAELPHRAADPRWTSSAIRDLLEHAHRPDIISLAGGLPADEALPFERLAQCSATIFERRSVGTLQYGSTAGEPALREIIGSYEAVHPDELVITTGSQQALDLVARTMGQPGDTVVVESPGYVGAIQVFRGQQFALHGCPVDAHGLDTDRLEADLMAGLRPRFVYTNPIHQNPTGARLSPSRAAALLRLAERFDFWIVVDDPYREITIDGPVPSPEEGLHPSSSERVLLLGSLSKTLSPGLRIGWCSGPTDAIRTITIAKQAADLHTATLNQRIAASVLSDHRWWVQHLQHLRSLYGRRRSELAAAVAAHLPGATVVPTTGGFFSWLELEGVDTSALLDVALPLGVAFVPGAAFSVDGRPTHSLRLSHSFAPVEAFDEGLRRLAGAIETARQT